MVARTSAGSKREPSSLAARKPCLEARGISKFFGHVTALDNVTVSLYPGEALALVGDNGAGKSTLVSILSGVAQPDAGSDSASMRTPRSPPMTTAPSSRGWS